MSDDIVNQITLNFLISKGQLHKLNKKMKENTETKRKTDKEIYGERITELFNNLLQNQGPENLLEEVNIAFEIFLDKCIYYFKSLDNNELLEKERNNEESQIIHDDIDFEKEERDIENGNYKEKDEDEEDEDEEDEDDEVDEVVGDDDEEDKYVEDEEDEDEEDEDEETKSNIKVKQSIVNVKNKFNNKNSNSVGVDDIQKLPLDWFQNVRQNYKKNQIIPRKKEINIEQHYFREEKKKI